MRNVFIYLLLYLTFFLGIQEKKTCAQTYCNPLNLSSQFNPGMPLKPGIADPCIVLYKDNYYLFASKAGGYWHSGDLLDWKFVTADNLPLENTAPTAVVIGDWLYFFTSLSKTIFRSKDPTNGKWEVFANNSILLSTISDFAIFLDTDGRVYCYYGCSNNDGVMARELDPNNQFNAVGIPVVCKKINALNGGKKLKANTVKTGSYNLSGSWMNKYNGKYYYQCSEFNSQLNNYSDAVYVSDDPLGPFTFAPNNPFSYRPDGFVCGAGNGSTFADKNGNWWHIATMTASAMRESPSRLGLFPSGFDKDGNLFTKTDFGDYPMIMPKIKYSDITKLDPKWSLLADHLIAQASSSLATFPATLAFDENIGTYWSAQTGDKGEWLSVDLGSVCTINAFQLNFVASKAKLQKRDTIFAYQYLVEYSMDKKNWKMLIDKTSNTKYETNPYEELSVPIQAKYVKITNYRVPNGTFAISGFRIFGSGAGRKPKKITSFRAVKDYRDQQVIKMSWEKEDNATGYNIRFGSDKDKLYHSYQVFKTTRLTIHCPDKSDDYWFAIDTFNENGVTPGKPQLSK